MKRVWKRNLEEFALNGDWTEQENPDGSVTYTAGGVDSDAQAFKQGRDTPQDHANEPAGTKFTYWPDTGKLKVVYP